MKSYEQTVQELLKDGFIKVGSKSSALPDRERKVNMTRIAMESFSNSFTEYERGYEAALKQIKRNLEHMCKGMWSVEMCYDGSPNNAEDLDRYEGESECYSFLLEELNLDKV